MAHLITIGGAWLATNGAIFCALLLRRRRPQLQEKMFGWVVSDGARGRSAATGIGRHHSAR